MTPPSGLEPTPSRGFPFLTCPHCGKPLARVAFPAVKLETQAATAPAEPIAPELAPEPSNDRRLAPTDRLPRKG